MVRARLCHPMPEGEVVYQWRACAEVRKAKTVSCYFNGGVHLFVENFNGVEVVVGIF